MDRYPYTNFHELNLVYFLKHFKEIFQQWDSLYQEMQSWKTATEEELETWKNGVVADIEAWEATILGEVGDWEDALMASLEAWKTAFESLFDSTFSDLEEIKTDAEAARDAAIAAQEAAEDAQAAAEAAAASLVMDKTLTIAGVAAESETVGVQLRSVNTFNIVASHSANDKSGAPAPTGDGNGVTFTWSENGRILTVTKEEGVTQRTSFLPIKGGTSTMPYNMKAGETYRFKIHHQRGNATAIGAQCFDENRTSLLHVYTTSTNPVRDITIPDGTVGILIQLRVYYTLTIDPDGDIVDGFEVYNVTNLSNTDLTTEINDLKIKVPDKQKIKIMQYNAGMFNMGGKVPYGLPDSIYSEMIDNYREFLLNSDADIIGIEEYPAYIDRSHTETPAGELFDAIYANKHIYSAGERALFTRYPIISSSDDNPTISYTYDGSTVTTSIYYTLNVLNIAEKEVPVIVTALRTSADGVTAAGRIACLNYLLNLPVMVSAESAFLILDMNNNGDGVNTGLQEAAIIKNALENMAPSGVSWSWKMAMGDYMPFRDTYNDVYRLPAGDSFETWSEFSVRGRHVSTVNAIDNVIFKSNDDLKKFEIMNDHVDITDWIPLTLKNDATVHSIYHVPSVKVSGNIASLRGWIMNVTQNQICATLPYTLWPETHAEGTTIYTFNTTAQHVPQDSGDSYYYTADVTMAVDETGNLQLTNVTPRSGRTYNAATDRIALFIEAPFIVENLDRKLFSDHYPVIATFEV